MRAYDAEVCFTSRAAADRAAPGLAAQGIELNLNLEITDQSPYVFGVIRGQSELPERELCDYVLRIFERFDDANVDLIGYVRPGDYLFFDPNNPHRPWTMPSSRHH
jgi:hypothetical protein